MKDIIDNLLKLQTLEVSDTAAANAEPIQKLRTQIPAPILAHYDRLVARGKKGVAAVRNQVCTGCHVQVPLNVTMTIMHGDDIQICENCGRYLYLPPAAPAPTEEPKATPPKRAKSTAGTKKRGPQLQTV